MLGWRDYAQAPTAPTCHPIRHSADRPAAVVTAMGEQLTATAQPCRAPAAGQGAALTDSQLVNACLQGNEAAWTELWCRYGGVVKAVARRLGCTADESRDVLQLVALTALEKLSGLRDPDKLAAWLAGVARNRARELRRKRLGAEEIGLESAIAAGGADEELLWAQQLGLLRAALLELDERCQRLLRRLDLSEPAESYQAAAAAEGLAASSIGPIRRRCLNRLRKIFERLSRSLGSAHDKGRGQGKGQGGGTGEGAF